MKGALLLTVVLVGLVAVHGHWERNKVYKYEVKAKGLKYSDQSMNEPYGYARYHLTLRPHSDDVIIGQITDAEFTTVRPQRYDDKSQSSSGSNERNLDNSPMKKPFKINLRNGVIQSLGVDRSLSKFDKNQLKLTMSQFQVDTNKAQNRNSYGNQRSLESNENWRRTPNRRSSEDDSNTIYKTMEPSGQCQTTYEISPLPDYLVKANPHWVPMPQISERNDEIIKIRKTKDSHDCEGRRSTLVAAAKYLSEKNVRENDLYIVEEQRIVVSGSVQRFTIQSALSSVKLMYRPGNTQLVGVYLNATLESVESASQRYDSLPENLEIVENLNFDFDPKQDDSRSRLVQPRLNYDNVGTEYRWTTTCWSAFMWGDAACHSDFGYDWSYTGHDENCGFLGLRKQCKRG